MGKYIRRDRTLGLLHLLMEETEEKHPLSMREMMEKLARQGFTPGRKCLYQDLAALRRNGLDIQYRAGAGGGWYLANRPLDREELRILADAVTVYRWVPEKDRARLLKRLRALAPAYLRESLDRPVARPGRGAGEPEEVRAVLDRIYTACQSHRALSFVPFEYTQERERAAAGPRRVVSPKGVLWDEERYVMLALDHATGELTRFPVDRMAKVLLTGAPEEGKEVDLHRWVSAPFGTDLPCRERVRLRFHQAMAGEVMDRFGEEATLTANGDQFTVTADVVIGPAFWGWMTAHGDQAAVLSPAWAARVWREQYQPRPPKQPPKVG